MKNTITEAMIYENQGLREDAIEVYKNILKAEPNNTQAQSAIRRLSGLKRKNTDINDQMCSFFLNLKESDEIGIREFKRWLVKI